VRLRRTALLAMAAAVYMVAGSPAQAAANDGGIVDASKRVAGFTSGQLLGEEWRQLIELPLDANPLAGTGNDCLSAGHRPKVLIVWTTTAPADPAVCDVKPGTPVFFQTLGGECSSVEPEPFFGETERDQRRCILGFLRTTPFNAILVTIDDRRPVNIGLERFIAVSRQGKVHLPDPNVFGVPGNRRATFVAGGYAALPRPLRPGTHTITVTTVGGPFAGTNRAVVNVVPGHR
jgi:hypothetical protein